MPTLKKAILFIIISCIARVCFAGEGMWIPLLLKALNESEMQEMGMKMTAEDIYSVNQGSLKDALVHFGGFCSSAIISPQGLLLTNHHCGYRQIQAHSSLENNFLENGFWADSLAAELPNPDLTATLIVRIEDVTKRALQGVSEEMDGRIRRSLIDKNIQVIIKRVEKATYEDVSVKPFFKGNQFFLFVTVTYKDVRLVGAPPSSIGKFGADTDNWVWPRHTGDFSLFRIYADKNNLPAEYARDNVPFKPKHFLPISVDGVAEGDFTLVFGFPGRTDEYLPSPAVEQIIEVIDPARIAIRTKSLQIMNAAMRADPAVKIQYASKQSGLSNGWKKWQGEILGLKKTNALAKKRLFEDDFTKMLLKNPAWHKKYGSLIKDFATLYKEIEPLALSRIYYSELTGRNVELLKVASRFRKLTNAFQNNGVAGYEKYKQRLLTYLRRFSKNYRPEIDQKIFTSLMEMYVNDLNARYVPDYLHQLLNDSGGNFEKMATDIFQNSFLTDTTKVKFIFERSPADAINAIQNDPAFQIAKSMAEVYKNKVEKKYKELNDKIINSQHIYMAAMMEIFPNRRLYPDANGTLRVTYGNVQSYAPRDAVKYEPVTYLKGVMEKYVPGDYEFDVPEKLQKLYDNKDYGPYGADGKMPVCFIGTNHTTGGNSGSPVIDAYGNLIGLNFDRAWEGTMSDINYDPSICRNIMVDIRYVLFLVDKFAGAKRLIEEMELVHPKQASPTTEK